MRENIYNQQLLKNEKSKDYGHNNVYCFFITIFRLAIPAFFKLTDVTKFMIGTIIFYKITRIIRAL